MECSEQAQITRLLGEWRQGDRSAFERLLPHVYAQLHQIARQRMVREGPRHVLQTTALIHEAWLRMVGQTGIEWQSRSHFFAIAARTMRQILIDVARSGNRAKRGAGAAHLNIDDAGAISQESFDEFLVLNDLLDRLAQVDERKAKIVEMRFFGGMSVEETAEVLDVSENTVIRDWSLARAWLRRELEPGGRKT